MGHPNTPKKTPTLGHILVSLAVAGVVGGSLAMIISQTSEQPQEWVQCFEDIESAIATGADANEALTVLRAERSEDERKLEAHQRALHQLKNDWRWEDSEQQEWLDLASQQTRDQIAELQESVDESGDTEGCLEEY